MKSKQTAVEWLVNQILFLDWNHLQSSKKLEIFEQAKEMEKEQIVDAYYYDPNCDEIKDDGEQYYNKTYEK